eukprot:351877-Chlamydomonas_euryale.AAC.1
MSRAAQRAGGRTGGGKAAAGCAAVLSVVVEMMDLLASQPRQQAADGGSGGGGAAAAPMPGPVLRQVSGVVLLHVMQASRYDACLVPAWLATLGGPNSGGGGNGERRAGHGAFGLSLLCALC